MSRDTFLVSPNERPSWLSYPHSFCWIVDQMLIHITPWHIFEAREALHKLEGLRQRYPSRAPFPFAYRQDNDDVACWAENMGEKVFIIHDFASQGWEDDETFEDVWSWFRSAVDETASWD